MKTLKRMLCLALCIAMALAVTACKKDETPAGNTGNEQTQQNENKETENKPEEKDNEPEKELSEEEAWKLEPAYGQTVYYLISNGCSAGPGIADELGYFEELGIKAEGLKADSDVEGLGTNLVQIAVGHVAKQLVPATNGVDLVFVGGAHSGCKTLFVLNDSPYQTTADLKGLKIATPNGIGNSDYNITARLLAADGINPMTDVELTAFDNSACVPAMQNGELAAALLSDTYAYSMVKEGILRPIRSMLDEDLNQLCCAITMNGTFVKENPITAKKMVQAVKKAHEWIANDPAAATTKLLEIGLNSGDYDMNVEVNTSLLYGPTDEFTESQLRQIAADYKELGLCTTNDDVDTIMSKVWMPMAPDQ